MPQHYAWCDCHEMFEQHEPQALTALGSASDGIVLTPTTDLREVAKREQLMALLTPWKRFKIRNPMWPFW